MSDIGLTHIALPATNMEASLTFYSTYARMRVVHRRIDPDGHTLEIAYGQAVALTVARAPEGDNVS